MLAMNPWVETLPVDVMLERSMASVQTRSISGAPRRG